MPDAPFMIQGRIRGVPTLVQWEPALGFSDPSGEIDLAIRLGNQVTATPTGPAFDADDSPALVAYLTALSVFDSVDVIEGAEDVVAALQAQTSIPPDATA